MSRTILATLKIRGFRNLPQVDAELSPGVNVLRGENAQGKSNTLEAIHFLATATSPRTFHISEVIPKGGASAYVEGRIERPDGPETLSVGLDATRKLIRSNDARLARVHEIYGRLAVVSFVPEDLSFVNGTPHDRRRLLDVALAQMEPAHVVRLLSYNRALRHRNALLRAGRWSELEMETWEEELSRLGAEIMRARGPLCRRLAARLSQLYQDLLGGRELLVLAYHPSFTCGQDESRWPALLLERLQRQREADRERGATHAGPHRDNLDLYVEERELKLYGSQGQRRTAVLALRLAEAEEMAERLGSPPLLLADDVVYEMDPGRREAFLRRLATAGQCFLTATDPAQLGSVVNDARMFHVKHGQVEHERG